MPVTWQEICEYAEKMHLTAATLADLKPCFDRLDADFFAFAVQETTGNFFPESEVSRRYSPLEGDRFRQLCVIANYPKMAEFYRRNAFPEQMLADISADFAVWSEHHWSNYGTAGISADLLDWAQCCLTGRVRQFGRLQCNHFHNFSQEYSFYRRDDGSLEKVPFGRPGNPPHPALAFGDKCINMHIPASGKLDIAACVDSMRRMADFYAEFFPDYDYRAFTCYSWLLSPAFAGIMPASSNIVQFGTLGHRFELENFDCTRSVIWRVWGVAAADSVEFPDPDKGSSLQRNTARYLRGGGRFKEGVMIILRDELPALFRRKF